MVNISRFGVFIIDLQSQSDRVIAALKVAGQLQRLRLAQI
jgi:hypothetical protein